METLENRNTIGIDKLKNDILNLNKEQIRLKNQTRTVRLVGERTCQPWEAQCLMNKNRMNLVLMYAAYQTLRGKEVIEPKTLKTDYAQWYFYNDNEIQSIVKKYTIEKKKMTMGV